MGKCRKLKTTKNNGQSQAEEQSVESSNSTQFGEQQIQEESQIDSHTSLGSAGESSSKGEKRTRGYTHMLDVWDMPDGEFILVEVDPLGNPMGWEGKTLLNAIGSLIRRHQCAPISYLSWTDMPGDYITDMFGLIQDISDINKRNRSKYEDIHCMGTKNLPRVIDEMKTKAKGVQPSRAQVYIETRTRNDGSIVNEKAATVIDELKKHMIEAESSHNLETTQESTDWKNDIYSKVKGPEKRGRVRCLGKVFQHASSSQSSNANNRAQKLENLLSNLVDVLQARFAEDPEVNHVLQAIAQEVPSKASNDSVSKNHQTTSDPN